MLSGDSQCAACGALANFMCSACKGVHYCSTQCQVLTLILFLICIIIILFIICFIYSYLSFCIQILFPNVESIAREPNHHLNPYPVPHPHLSD